MILSGATDLPMLIPDIPEAIYYGCGTYAADGKEPVQPENGLTIPEMLKNLDNWKPVCHGTGTYIRNAGKR